MGMIRSTGKFKLTVTRIFDELGQKLSNRFQTRGDSHFTVTGIYETRFWERRLYVLREEKAPTVFPEWKAAILLP